MPQYSDGPWTHTPEHADGCMPGEIRCGTGPRSFPIARVIGLGPEAMANARLLASAPRLHGALSLLLDEISDLSDTAREEINDEIVVEADAALRESCDAEYESLWLDLIDAATSALADLTDLNNGEEDSPTMRALRSVIDRADPNTRGQRGGEYPAITKKGPQS